VSVGKGEVLLDDSLLFHEKLVKAGVKSTLSAVPGMDHVAVVQSLAKPGAAETFEEVVKLIESVLAA
jgi:acetyl esterase/lipase